MTLNSSAQNRDETTRPCAAVGEVLVGIVTRNRHGSYRNLSDQPYARVSLDSV
jgi:hypothetical protein